MFVKVDSQLERRRGDNSLRRGMDLGGEGGGGPVVGGAGCFG